MSAFWHGFKTAALRKEVELQPHQTRALNKLKKNDALLLYHGLGSGKSLTSIAGTEDTGADVVVPAALRGNYAKEVRKFTKRGPKRNVMSYEAAAKTGLPGGEALVIDEAQRLGTSATTRSQALREAAPKYKKRILLSGTPVRNAPHELAPLIRILNPASRIPLDQKEFDRHFIEDVKVSPGIIGRLRGLKPGIEQRAKNLGHLRGEVRGRVDYHMPTREHYPGKTEETRTIPMDDEQAKIYKTVTQQANPIIAAKVRSNLPLSKRELTNLNAFMTAARMVSNTTAPYGGKGVSNKVKTMVTDLVEGHNTDPNFKSVTYSNYLEGGVHELAKHLAENNIPHAVFSGELSDKKRKQVVDDYNNGKIKALLISGAGSEGLDLKGTKLFQVMEPHWNQARTEQAKGRAIRYKSHAHLPEDERNVRVVNYHSTLPNTFLRRMFKKEAPTAADQYLHALGGKKQVLINQFLDVLKEEGEKNAFLSGFHKQAGDRVFIYRNIRKGKDSYTYSVRQNGKVVGHETSLTLVNPQWIVSQKGNARVRLEGAKNVHAGIRGERSRLDEKKFDWVPVTYDPRKHSSFISRLTGEKIEKSDAAKLSPSGALAGFLKREVPA